MHGHKVGFDDCCKAHKGSTCERTIMSNSVCWICGGPAATGEHKTKQSDLRAVLGTPKQEKPFYYQHVERLQR